MATQGFEIPNDLREFADKGVVQARSAVGSIVTGAAKASGQIESATVTLQSSVHAAVLKGLEHVETNANATFDHVQRLARAADIKEAFAIQTEFMKGQFAALQAQAKDLAAFAERAKP